MPVKVLVKTTIDQALILVTVGLILGGLMASITAKVIPLGVPLIFSTNLVTTAILGILATGLLGAIIPIRTILKVNPVTAIGG